jgi:hypothetical protein
MSAAVFFTFLAKQKRTSHGKLSFSSFHDNSDDDSAVNISRYADEKKEQLL